MKHMKRQMMPTSWPISRKGKTWVVKPISNTEKGIPILVILRDMLKLAQNRKEVKKALYNKEVLLNNKAIKDEKVNAVLFDILSIIPLKKHFRISLTEKGKFALEEIDKKQSEFKTAKIVNKKTLKGKKTQLNLSDGGNIVSEEKCNTNDSVVLNLKNKKIEKCLKIKEGVKAIVFDGKHMGKKGKINKINKEKQTAELDLEGIKKQISIKQLMVIE